MVPACLKPTQLITSTIAVLAKIVQNAARNPFIDPGIALSDECSVTDDAMTAVTARPTEFPNCATSLTTPPARDWSSMGKASDMRRLEMLNRTISAVRYLKHGNLMG